MYKSPSRIFIECLCCTLYSMERSPLVLFQIGVCCTQYDTLHKIIMYRPKCDCLKGWKSNASVLKKYVQLILVITKEMIVRGSLSEAEYHFCDMEVNTSEIIESIPNNSRSPYSYETSHAGFRFRVGIRDIHQHLFK